LWEVFFLREKGDFDPPRGRARGAATNQNTSQQIAERQSKMANNGGQQHPPGGNGSHVEFQVVGPRRRNGVAPQGAAGQQATAGGRRQRSDRPDQPSPNARGGAAQRTNDDSAALTGGAMAMGQFAPAQAQQYQMQQQFWQQQQQPQTMQQAIEYPAGPYSHAGSGGAPSPGYDYGSSSHWQQVRRNEVAWHEADISCMTCSLPAFRLAVGTIA
jgi:hypothetical protein